MLRPDGAGDMADSLSVVPLMKAQLAGRIVVIGCSAPWTGLSGYLQYTTATSALIGITRSLARELGDFNISVNMVCPDPMPDVEREERDRGEAPDVDLFPPVLVSPDGAPGLSGRRTWPVR